MVEQAVNLIPKKISPKIKQYKPEGKLISVKSFLVNNFGVGFSFDKHSIENGLSKKSFDNNLLSTLLITFQLMW